MKPSLLVIKDTPEILATRYAMRKARCSSTALNIRLLAILAVGLFCLAVVLLVVAEVAK